MLLPTLVVATALAIAPPPKAKPRQCPSEAEVKRQLAVDGPSWRVACRVHGQALLLAALHPRRTPDAPPRLVVAVVGPDGQRRGEMDLHGAEIDEVREADWTLSISLARVRGADWLRVDAVASAGQDLRTSDDVVTFVRDSLGGLQHVWTGLGDHVEVRFDACRLETKARFGLSPKDGALVRTRRTTRAFADPGGLDGAVVKELKAACVARPRDRQTFATIDDGVNANIDVAPELRERIKNNRLLYIRALESAEAFRLFAESSASLVPLLREAVSDAPASDDVPVPQIVAPGAQAYLVGDGVWALLHWAHLAAAAGPKGRALVEALDALEDGGPGAWMNLTTCMGGCSVPAKAEPALRRLAAAWNATPDPIREALGHQVAILLDDMAFSTCFCAPKSKRSEISAALIRNAEIVDEIAPVGDGAARKLRELSVGSDARFSCAGPR